MRMRWSDYCDLTDLEEFMRKLINSVLDCRFDAVAEQMRGTVLDNSIMGDECRLNRSKENRKVYRIPANIESYEIHVRIFSLFHSYPVFCFNYKFKWTFFSLIWSIRWKHLRTLRRTYQCILSKSHWKLRCQALHRLIQAIPWIFPSFWKFCDNLTSPNPSKKNWGHFKKR